MTAFPISIFLHSKCGGTRGGNPAEGRTIAVGWGSDCGKLSNLQRLFNHTPAENLSILQANQS